MPNRLMYRFLLVDYNRTTINSTHETWFRRPSNQEFPSLPGTSFFLSFRDEDEEFQSKFAKVKTYEHAWEQGSTELGIYYMQLHPKRKERMSHYYSWVGKPAFFTKHYEEVVAELLKEGWEAYDG